MLRSVIRVVAAVASALPWIVSTASCAGGRAPEVVVNEKVAIVPGVRAGWVGWCALMLGNGTCAATGHRPVLVEAWTGSSPPPVTEGMALTTSETTALALYEAQVLSARPPKVRYVPWKAAHVIPTERESTLPKGLRVAVVQLRGVFIGPRRLPPRFVPLNARGTPILEAATQTAIGIEVPTRAVNASTVLPGDPCVIEVRHLSEALVFGARVVVQAGSHRGLIGRPFMSCSNTLVQLGGWRVTAAVLIDAVKPGDTPAALPEMQSVAGHLGTFEAVCSEGRMVARRIPGAWLVATGGSGLQQRLTVLEHLRASVRVRN